MLGLYNVHSLLYMNMQQRSTINIQARVQEFVRGGGAQNLKAFIFAFQFFMGGPSSETS